MAAINLVEVPVRVTVEVDKASELHAQFVAASKELTVSRAALERAVDRFHIARNEKNAAEIARSELEAKRDDIVRAMYALADGNGE